MKTYKVDLDYENYLFDESYDPNLKPYMKINQSFEFAFFIVNKQKCKLQNSKPYPREYLARLKKDHFYTFLSFSNALSRTFSLFYLMSGYALNCNKRQSKNPVGS